MITIAEGRDGERYSESVSEGMNELRSFSTYTFVLLALTVVQCSFACLLASVITS